MCDVSAEIQTGLLQNKSQKRCFLDRLCRIFRQMTVAHLWFGCIAVGRDTRAAGSSSQWPGVHHPQLHGSPSGPDTEAAASGVALGPALRWCRISVYTLKQTEPYVIARTDLDPLEHQSPPAEFKVSVLQKTSGILYSQRQWPLQDFCVTCRPTSRGEVIESIPRDPRDYGPEGCPLFAYCCYCCFSLYPPPPQLLSSSLPPEKR